MLRIDGSFNDGRTSRVQEATLILDDTDALSIVAGGDESGTLVGPFPPEQAKIHKPLGSTPRVIGLPESARFTTDDNAAVDELQRIIKGDSGTSLLHRLENKLSLVVVFAVCSLVMAWLFITVAIPAMSTYIAYSLPDEVNRTIGGRGLGILDSSLFKPTQLEQEERTQILEHFNDLPGSRLEARILFREVPKMGANAFALPPDIVVFTDELVRQSEHPDELTAVLMHELGHLEHRHITRRSLQGSLITLFAILMVGDVSGINEVIATIPGLLIDASYSREFEREADRYAIEQLQQRKIPASRFGDILRKITKSTNARRRQGAGDWIRGYLSTHPLTKERLETITTER